MLKTRKLISLVLVVAMVLSMAVVGIVSASAAEGDYYLMGSMNGWAITDGYAFTENSDNPGEYMLMGVTLSSSDTFKVKVDNGDKDTGWYPDGMGNDGTVDADGTYNIYFNPNGNPEWTANSGYCYLELATQEPETDEPTDEPETDEPTSEPETDEPTSEPETDEPTVAPTEGGDPSGKTAVTIDGKEFEVHVGDKIHYENFLDLSKVNQEGTHPGRATEIQGDLYYDNTKLKLLTPFDVDDDGKSEFVPNLVGDGTVVNDAGDRVSYNGTKGNTSTSPTAGYNFSSEKVLVHADFEVIADGTSSITHVLQNLGSGEVKVIYNGENPSQIEFDYRSTASVECPHGQQTDATTATEDKTEATDAPPVGGKAVVTIEDWDGSTQTREFNVGDKFTVTSYLQVPEGKRVNSIDINQEFNIGDAAVKFIGDVDAVDDPEADNPKSLMFPNIKGLVANREGNVIKANGSAAKYAQSSRFNSADSILITADYEVVAAGTTKIKTNIVTMATITSDDAMTNQIMNGEKVGTDDINTSTVFDKIIPVEPTTDEPATDEPATDEPATDAPTLGSTYYLTGSIAGWGPKAGFEFIPTNNAEAEEYAIQHVALTTEDMIKGIKTSKNGLEAADWYPDGMDNNITVDHDSTYTVYFRPNGDGKAEEGWIYSWYADEAGEGKPYEKGGATLHGGYLFKLVDENAEPGTEESQPATDKPTDTPPVGDKVYVVADGKWYEVEKDEIVTYIYYLNTGEKVCSLDGETFFDTDGLELVTDTEDMENLFPIIKDAMVLNDTVAGRLKYNYSAAKGKTFDSDDSQLICAQFKVTADKGVYHIDTYLHTVAGEDEHKYIFKDEVLDALQKSEGVLNDKTPVEPGTEPGTDETQAPDTQAPDTQAPDTQAPDTQAPDTQAPDTQAPDTEPGTEAAIDEYEFEQNPYTWYTESGEDLVMVVHNKDLSLDEATFDKFMRLVINGNTITEEEGKIAFTSGSLVITINKDHVLDYAKVGENTVYAEFSVDAEEGMIAYASAETVLNVVEGTAPTEAEETEVVTPSENTDETVPEPAKPAGAATPDEINTNPNTVQTGSTEMAIIFLVILVMAAGIVIYTKKRKVD